MKGLTDVPGILVGHVTDAQAHTGCTVILCGNDAVGGVDVRGSANGSCEIDVLSPSHVAANVHAIVLAGGSAFGLEAACGVRRALEKRGVGFAFGGAHVPIVSGAILFDLGIGNAGVRPDREMGEKAVVAASDAAVIEGNVGAGTGATCRQDLWHEAGDEGRHWERVTHTRFRRDGSGAGSRKTRSAMCWIRKRGRIVAGARTSPQSREFVNSAAAMRHGIGPASAGRGNTTLAVVATNARFDKVQTNKIAALASLGVARTISPVNTMSDGDMTFAISLGREQASVDAVGCAAAEALAMAVVARRAGRKIRWRRARPRGIE